MTVTYSSYVAYQRVGVFLRLLRRWKGSIYKLVYKELALFWIAYFTFNLFYRFILYGNDKENFMHVCIFCKRYTNYVPLTFLLGFYVNMIAVRWWKIFKSLPWTDSVALKVVAYVPNMDDRSRLIRRTLMRWLNLSNILVLRSVSSAARKRYPTMDVVGKCGFILEHEQQMFDSYTYPSHMYWVPIKWSMELLNRSTMVENIILNDRYLIELVTEINAYRKVLGALLDYDWVQVPLVYTQVVTIAVYTFFMALLFSRQYLGPEKADLDRELVLMKIIYADPQKQMRDPYSPVVFTTMQFLFYMGWLKVAETLINPLGLDDDDFEVNWLIARNLKYSLLVVDGMYGKSPVMERDIFWDEIDILLPYTEASLGVKDQAPKTSTQGVQLTEKEMAIVAPTKISDSDSSSSLVKTFTEKFAGKLGIKSEKEVDLEKSVPTLSAPTKSSTIKTIYQEASPQRPKKSKHD